MTGEPKGTIEREPAARARKAARRFHATVALKGEETFIADRSGRVWRNRKGNAGLAISGSGDTLSGIAAGLAARGAPPPQAAVWAVALHARAGDRLARRMGPLGFLPRELLAEIPGLMRELAKEPSRRS
jgi:NAD(P)H-hydrate repair Nnr-like enzyme with NAD(P)H-hydrate dehydratase domain